MIQRVFIKKQQEFNLKLKLDFIEITFE